MASDGRTVVCDIGSNSLKAGFSGEEHPRCQIPSVYGVPLRTFPQLPFVTSIPHRYLGDDAVARRGVLSLHRVVERGIVTDWDEFETLFMSTLAHLRIERTDACKLLLTESPLNSFDNHEKLVQIMFETFGFGAIFSAWPGVLALYGNGLTTGMVLDVGEDVTSVVPVYRGFLLRDGVRRVHYAGGDITAYLGELLAQSSGPSLGTSQMDLYGLQGVKERFAAVKSRQDERMEINEDFVLPDGTSLRLGAPLHECAEGLFDPTLLGLEAAPVHALVLDALRSAPLDCRSELFGKVLLAGGTTMLPGFPERLALEFENSTSNLRAKIVAPPQREYAAWCGGSLWSSMATFQQKWISKAQYADEGPSVLLSEFAQSATPGA